MSLAPLLIFCYKRKSHLERVVKSLLLNSLSTETEVFIFSDNAKTDNDVSAVNEVRSYIHSITGFKKITIIERDVNFGLARSIITGVTETLKNYESVIVLEDDIVVSPYFLNYMNDMLGLYSNDQKVASIHAYVYPAAGLNGETFFLKGADCWGWATWKRAWSGFESDGAKLLAELNHKNLKSKFNYDNSYPFYEMLVDQIAGKNNSWAIRWNASMFLKDMYTLYPTVSFVQNIGNDSSGTHCGDSELFDVVMNTDYKKPAKIEISGNKEAYVAFRNYFNSLKPGLLRKILNKLKVVA